MVVPANFLSQAISYSELDQSSYQDCIDLQRHRTSRRRLGKWKPVSFLHSIFFMARWSSGRIAISWILSV